MVQYAHLNTITNLVDGFYDDSIFDYASAGTLPVADLYVLSPSDWNLRLTGSRWTITAGALVAVPLPTATIYRQAADTALAARIATGIVITCTGNAAVSGTYAAYDELTTDIGIVARDFSSGLGLPGGIATCTYRDLAGVVHTFTAAQMVAAYKAVRDYRYLLQVQHDLVAISGAAPVWASNSYVIP